MIFIYIKQPCRKTSKIICIYIYMYVNISVSIYLSIYLSIYVCAFHVSPG